MSGGVFDFNNYVLDDMANLIRNKIESNNEPPYDENTIYIWEKEENEYFFKNGAVRYQPETIEVFKEAEKIFKLASIYAHRIDWFLSGDDGENTFLRRLKEEIDDFENNF